MDKKYPFYILWLTSGIIIISFIDKQLMYECHLPKCKK